MENKHLGVTLRLFLLISGLFPIAGSIQFFNETSSTESSISLVNPPELKSDNKLSKPSSNELKKEFNVTDNVTEIKEFVLPNECSSSYKV